MASALTKDAVHAGRTTLFALAATSLIWLLTYPAVARSLRTEDRVRELAAWLALREAFPATPDGELRISPTTCLTRLVPIQSGTEHEVCDPVDLHLEWLGEGTHRLTLTPTTDGQDSRYTVGDIRSKVPVSTYHVVAFGGRVAIFPSGIRSFSDRSTYNAALRDDTAVPRSWDSTRVLLRARGWTGASADDLRLGDPAVAKLLSEGLDATFSISGMTVSPRLYPIVVSLVLGALAFSLVGPILALRRAAPEPLDDSWTMLAYVRGVRRVPLVAIQLAAGLLTVWLPYRVGETQLREILELLPPRDAWITGVAALLPFGAAVATFLFVLALAQYGTLSARAIQRVEGA